MYSKSEGSDSMKTALFVLLDHYADWEAAYLMSLLNQREKLASANGVEFTASKINWRIANKRGF
jgi:hypothetical protein